MNVNLKILFSLCWCVICARAVVKKWPSRYPRCHRDDPDLNKCILEATKTMKPFLKQGLPELNIAPISPFFIPEIKIEQGTSSVNYNVRFKNVTILGFDTYEFEKFGFDVKNLLFDAALDISSLNVTGFFTVNGKILTVPIEGNGKMSASVGRSSGTFQNKVKLVTKNGKTHLDTEKLTVKLNIGEIIDYHLEGLFDQNEVLAKAAYRVIDDNKEILIEEVKPAVEEVVGQIVDDILKKSLVKFPFDEVFPSRNNTSAHNYPYLNVF